MANNQGYTKRAKNATVTVQFKVKWIEILCFEVVDPNNSTIVEVSVNPSVTTVAKQVKEWVTDQIISPIPILAFTYTLKPGEFALFEIITNDLA